ncbi:hypothetical protein OG381_44795 [Streptomyces sp. NBC_00490]|uniref:hypothetical protein n=1 Tax=Streptomyces sp. NBC_00490 TaxID=2903657 RepID=UPI002E182639
MSSRKVAGAAKLLNVVFTVAVAMNLAAAIWHPNGTVWRAARLTVSVLFFASLGHYLALLAIRWRQRRRRELERNATKEDVDGGCN